VTAGRATGRAARRGPGAAAPASAVIEARQGGHRYEVHVGPGAAEAILPIARRHDRVVVVTARPVLRSPVARRAIARL
jgi:3-dehydroquinate synthase